MIKAERGLQGLLLAGLALAAVGSASCQRPPEATPLPQRTPLAAPGEPIPSDIEAEIQRRVQATVTAQATTPDVQVIVTNPSIGNVTRGSKLFVQKGCVACHMLVGVKEATGTIGPNLTGVATRPRIPSSTGEVKNTPEEMRRWLMNPASIKPSTIMPPLGLTDAETRDIVDFLTQSAPQPPKPGQPSARPAEAPRQTQPSMEQEKPKTLFGQAAEKSLVTWINLLPSFHDTGNGGILGIRLNPDSTSLKKLLDPNIPPAQKLVKVKWISLPWGFGTNKIVGEAEIRNIKSVITPMGLSEADRANGILFSGGGSLTYIIRFRATEYTFRYTFGSHKNEAWSTSHKDRLRFANTTDAPWSLWQEGGEQLQIRLVDENWTTAFNPGLPINIISQTKDRLPTAPFYAKSDIPLPDAIAQKIKVESDLVKSFDIP